MDIVRGRSRNPQITEQLCRTLDKLELTGTLYTGYPIISTADETIIMDAMLTCLEHGVVVFDLNGSVENLEERQNDLYMALVQRLLAFRALRKGRELRVEANVISIVPVSVEIGKEVLVATTSQIADVLKECNPIADEELRFVNAAIQRVTTIRPPQKRKNVKRTDSRGGVLRAIEQEIANLDQWQKQAAIELPEGPQRIRGLAGSGKTVILALKAAYLHAQNPDWNLALTFQTRSLYQQFKDLVRRFSFEHSNDEPDWDRLRILHAWGSSWAAGVYSEIARANQLEYHNFQSARSTFGYDSAFEGACFELLKQVQEAPRKIFDAVVIDEAQDLPQPFFELVYLSTRHPKRIVWAYDELQNLGSYSMAPPSELFGNAKDGKPRIPSLENTEGKPSADIILPICYRNTPWALTVAHALGFGIYRDEGLVQFFDQPELWSDIGYETLEGAIEPGSPVVLRRHTDSYPDYFKEYIGQTNAVKTKKFENEEEQYRWVAAEITKTIKNEELLHRDFLIILPNPFAAKHQASRLIAILNEQGLEAHLVGVTSSTDEVFVDRSVAISGIYRAKGNEAAIVYVLNSDYCYSGMELIRRRNILFTAITRSRAWVWVCGVGDDMSKLEREVDRVINNQYRLNFQVPLLEELMRIRRIHRDMTPQEIKKTREAAKQLKVVLDLIEQGEVAIESLPADMLNRLRRRLEPNDADGE